MYFFDWEILIFTEQFLYMQHIKYFWLAILLVFSACKQKSEGNKGDSQDVAFNTYKEGFINDLWNYYPDWATSIGNHAHDGDLVIPDTLFFEREMMFVLINRDSLQQFDLSKLSDNNKTDYYLIKNHLDNIEFAQKELKTYVWDPGFYNLGSSFSYILAENYDALPKRMASFFQKMGNLEKYYYAAKTNIKNPSPLHTELAIGQIEATYSIFEKDFLDSLKVVTLPETLKQDMRKRALESVKIMKDFVSFLKKQDKSTGRDFRLGKELYDKKFKYEIQSKYTPEQIYDSAVARKAFLHAEMGKLANQLWPKYMGNAPKPTDQLELIRRVIDTLSLQHVAADSFKYAIEQQLPELTAFIKAKDLLYLDPNKPLKVRDEPGYMAGVAGASMSSPGPYEKNGKAYYNVGTLEGWSKADAESYLREYNHYILQILNIHEALPGHYVQLVYSNKAPSIVKSVLQNGTMIEGWAVYSELMMMENGYGNPNPNATTTTPEFWLMYYKWNLRTTCNTILDISVHTKNMSEADALDLLMREAFQQRSEAEGKWHRVQVTNVQLCSYYTGFKEIYDLREAWKAKQGDKYTLKAFNETFLGYGSAPVKYIGELMMK